MSEIDCLPSTSSDICPVCGAPGAKRKNYGARVCDSCRVFFSRSVTNFIHYQCMFSKNCPITKRSCKACRYKKCLQVGMLPEEVGKRPRKTMVPYYANHEKMYVINHLFGPTLNQGLKALTNMKYMCSVGRLISYYKNLDETLLVPNGVTPSASCGNPNVYLQDLLVNPRKFIEQNTAAVDSVCDPSTLLEYPFCFTSHLVRSIVFAAEWYIAIEEFHSICSVDRILLLKTHVIAISAYILHYMNFKKQTTEVGNIVIEQFAEQQMDEKLEEGYNYYVKSRKEAVMIIQSILKELKITDTEMLLMRIIAMFHPHPSMTNEGRAIALQVRFRFSQLLGFYIQQFFPLLSENDVMKRVASILKIEKYIKICTEGLKPFLLQMVLKNYCGMDTPLGRELFLVSENSSNLTDLHTLFYNF